MQIHVPPLSEEELVKPNPETGKKSEIIRKKVAETRHLQLSRQGCLNARLSAKACETMCQLGETEQVFLKKAMNQLKLSARGYHRLLKVARTIADMRNAKQLALADIQKALSFKHAPK